MIDFNLVKKILARLYVIAGLLKKNKNFEPDTYTESKDIFYFIQRIETIVFSGRGEEKPANDIMRVLVDAFMPIESYEDYSGEEQDLILKDIVAYCLNDIENLKGMTLGETCIIGEVAEQLQYLNGVLYESAEFSAENSILINAGEIQEDAWQRLVNSIFKDEDHPRDDKGRFIDKLVNEHIMYVRSKEKQITKDVREIAKINEAHNIGLKYRLKTKSSASDKVRRDVEEKGITQIEAARDISDLIRYTQSSTTEDTVEKGFSTLKKLQERGYKIRKIKNFWLDKENPYNGVNVQLDSPEPDSVRLEIQFNTPHNVKIKEKMHKEYEEARKSKTKEEEEEIKKLMHEKYDDKWEAIDNIENFIIGNL